MVNKPMSDWGKKIWFDGKLVPFEEAKIHVMTHSLHYGVGVFEGIRAYELQDGVPGIFRLDEHIDRLINSSKTYRFELSYGKSEIRQAIIDTVRESGFTECYIRPIVFLNIPRLGIKPPSRKASLVIGVMKWGKYLGEAYYKGARVMTVQWRRPPPHVLPINAKATGNYLNSYLATIEAKERGYDEALLLDHRGFVSEGPGQNIFIIRKNKVMTPPLHASILPGITRDTVITLLREKFQLDVLETDITLGMLYEADEAFYAGTAVEVTPIREVDDRPIGSGEPGEITKRLQKMYDDIVHGRISEYYRWITRVD